MTHGIPTEMTFPGKLITCSIYRSIEDSMHEPSRKQTEMNSSTGRHDGLVRKSSKDALELYVFAIYVRELDCFQSLSMSRYRLNGGAKDDVVHIFDDALR
jgi:hypothetical protein